jgi:aminopeptidase N
MTISTMLSITLTLAQDETGSDPYYPTLGSTDYDVQHYTINLTVDVAANTISGTTTIEILPTEDLNTIKFDFSGLTVEEVSVNQTPAEFERNGTTLAITPSTSLTGGEAQTIAITYSGSPEPVDDPAVPWQGLGWSTSDIGIYVVNEPSGAMSWYPVNNLPTDKATYDYLITVPKPYVVAANGLLIETADTEQGDSTLYHWQSNDPIAAHVTAIYIGEFEAVTSTTDAGLTIRNYFPADVDSDTRAAFDTTPDMIDYFTSLVGDYPFEAYGVIVFPDPEIGFALENQTLSIFGIGAVNEVDIAHELAHQWYGNSVTPAHWSDVWLSEGFATYFQSLWVEHTQGETAFQAVMDHMYQGLNGSGLQPGLTADPGVENLYNVNSYYRGALTLHALRVQVGDDLFFQILREYFERYKNSSATTADFIAVAEEVSGQDLSELFDGWLYQTNLPAEPGA